jgi:hypothetical protein
MMPETMFMMPAMVFMIPVMPYMSLIAIQIPKLFSYRRSYLCKSSTYQFRSPQCYGKMPGHIVFFSLVVTNHCLLSTNKNLWVMLRTKLIPKFPDPLKNQIQS